jgi:hypothetical protein
MRISSFWLIILRRNESQAFRRILNSPVGLPAGTAIMLDRRERERRVLRLQARIERRQRERRAEPTALWQTHRFIVVDMAQLPIRAILLDAT